LIYSGETKTAGKTYPRFTLVYRKLEGNRVRKNFSSLESSKREAEILATRLSNGQSDVTKLTKADVAELMAARLCLESLEVSVSTAVREYVTALKRLPPGSTLFEAVESFAKRHPANMPRKLVAELVSEFIEDRRSGGCSAHNLRDLNIRLGRFARAFAMPLASIEPSTLREYIRSLTNGSTGAPAMNRSKENTLRAIKSLFNFARKQRYIPREIADEIAEVAAPKGEVSKIGIYTPVEVTCILNQVEGENRSALAIAAFAGLRLSEVSRIDWKEVKLAERFIVVEANKAKTAARRVIPMSENLAAWLAQDVRKEGPVSSAPNDNALGDRFERAAVRAKVGWQRNGFRHSWISYRVAVTKNVAQTALEAGNSPRVIFSSYRELVSEKDAEAWFKIKPSNETTNLIPLKTAAA